jgi:hypothetical protein
MYSNEMVRAEMKSFQVRVENTWIKFDFNLNALILGYISRITFEPVLLIKCSS